MSIGNFIRNAFTVVRYKNGSWEYGKSSANYLTKEYMEYFLNIYAVNACINIRADYLSKFKWGVKESQGINYDSQLLDVIKNPNIYQKSTVDFIKQYEIFRSVYGWTYQKTFGAKGFYPSALYNLNPSNIDFNTNSNNPFLIWKKKDINDIKDKTFTYDDNGIKKTYRFSEIMPFYDIANGVCEGENSFYTSPSKFQAIRSNLDNLGLAIDGENVILGSIGREAIFKEDGGKVTSAQYSGINGKKSISEKSRSDVDSKLNNTNMLRGRRMRSFTPDSAIKHLDMSLRPKDFGLDTVMSQQESIIARAFGVPNEIYQAWKNGSTFENQSVAEVKFIDTLQESVANDLAMTWTNSFGDTNTPFVATSDHIRSIQNEENKKADTAFKITQSLFNLTRTGMTETQAIDFLDGLGVNLND